MIYQWDEEKNKANYKKHGVYFEEAQTVWVDQMACEFFDEEHSNSEEDRFLKLGISHRNRTLLIVFCERTSDDEYDEIIRIISARKATKNERKTYEERI